jgi:transposase
MMTALSDKQDEVTKVVFSQTASLFENKIDVVFFDVTTLYFESIQSDELRAFGYSKDQKFQSVQVVLALATKVVPSVNTAKAAFQLSSTPS